MELLKLERLFKAPITRFLVITVIHSLSMDGLKDCYKTCWFQTMALSPGGKLYLFFTYNI